MTVAVCLEIELKRSGTDIIDDGGTIAVAIERDKRSASPPMI